LAKGDVVMICPAVLCTIPPTPECLNGTCVGTRDPLP
jgi:hypothetical protein